MKNTYRLFLLFCCISKCYAIPDFNLYLFKNDDDKLINWSKVLKTNAENSNNQLSNINLIKTTPYYIEKNIRDYTTADVVFSVQNNNVVYKTKSINNNFSLVNYDLQEENGCLSYSLSIIDKKTLIIRKLSDKFCYLDYMQNYPDRTFTYNIQISKYTNNQNGYSYLFIFNR